MSEISQKSDQQKLVESREKVIKFVRFGGGVLIVFGLMVFFDIGGISGLLGFETGDGMTRMYGGALMFVGLVDVVFVPRILEMAISSKK